eukprot:1121460-Pleurochrysis_carterae.AAC.1
MPTPLVRFARAQRRNGDELAAFVRPGPCWRACVRAGSPAAAVSTPALILRPRRECTRARERVYTSSPARLAALSLGPRCLASIARAFASVHVRPSSLQRVCPAAARMSHLPPLRCVGAAGARHGVARTA